MDDDENMNFNIYYLNFSKVYEISMMINNVIKSSMQREKSDFKEISEKTGVSIGTDLGSKSYLAHIKSGLTNESSNITTSSSKLIESLDVITTKSILLREIICKCQHFTEFDKSKEGDLLKIDKVRLSMLDEEKLRQIMILRKNALKGMNIEGFEVNNLILSMLQDYSYIFKGNLDNSDDEVLLKIPMEIENDFESEYNVDDLLIGHLSIIGVYKGTVTEDFIKKNTLNYFENLGTPVEPEKKVFKSSIPQSNVHTSKNLSLLSENNEKNSFHFIDIIALIQDVQFDQQIRVLEDKVVEFPWYKRIINFLRLGGKNNG